jgi:hypothetical protein
MIKFSRTVKLQGQRTMLAVFLFIYLKGQEHVFMRNLGFHNFYIRSDSFNLTFNMIFSSSFMQNGEWAFYATVPLETHVCKLTIN